MWADGAHVAGAIVVGLKTLENRVNHCRPIFRQRAAGQGLYPSPALFLRSNVRRPATSPMRYRRKRCGLIVRKKQPGPAPGYWKLYMLAAKTRRATPAPK